MTPTERKLLLILADDAVNIPTKLPSTKMMLRSLIAKIKQDDEERDEK